MFSIKVFRVNEFVLKRSTNNKHLAVLPYPANNARNQIVTDDNESFHLVKLRTPDISFNVGGGTGEVFQEWSPNGPPHKHRGSFRLEHDKSWTPVDEIAQKDKGLKPLTKLFDGLDAITYPVDSLDMDTH